MPCTPFDLAYNIHTMVYTGRYTYLYYILWVQVKRFKKKNHIHRVNYAKCGLYLPIYNTVLY